MFITSMKILNRDRNINIILAGILALVVGTGIARFSYTSLLPVMLQDALELRFSGILTSVNYVGYFSGAALAVLIKDLSLKVMLFRFGMVLCIVGTYFMGTTVDPQIWIMLRIIAGFGTAMAMVVGSAIVMYKLSGLDKTYLMGMHFSGIGISIVVADLIARGLVHYFSWQVSWQGLAIAGAIIILYPLYILSIDKEIRREHKSKKHDEKIFTPFALLLLLAYFFEGIGYVVSGTYLPSIIVSLEGMEEWGGVLWLIVGIAGIPSCMVMARVAQKYGILNVIMIAMVIQAFGIMIPAFSKDPWFNLMGAFLYGGTFVGLVSLFLSLGGSLAKNNPVILMGALTAAYSIGQISAPMYVVWLTEKSGTFSTALYLTSLIVMMGVLTLLVAKKYVKQRI